MDKKIASRSLSALVFALGASQLAQANPPEANAAEEFAIQNLELSEESALSFEELDAMVSNLRAASRSTNWGGSGGSIRAGNYANSIRAGNYANSIRAGNYANSIRAGNYANSVRAGNYGRLNLNELPDEIPSPVVLEALAGEGSSEE